MSEEPTNEIKHLMEHIRQHGFGCSAIEFEPGIYTIMARLSTDRQRGFDFAVSKSLIKFYGLDGLIDLVDHQIAKLMRTTA